MRSITHLNIQYAHRFLNYEGEAQYLHGHTGRLRIEVEGNVDKRTGFVVPCNQIKKTAWDYLQNFDHALILQKEDPLLPFVLETYEKQGIKDGVSTNRNIGHPIDNEFAKAYPQSRLVVVEKPATCENMIEIFYSLLKDSFNIKKMEFTSGDNSACCSY